MASVHLVRCVVQARCTPRAPRTPPQSPRPTSLRVRSVRGEGRGGVSDQYGVRGAACPLSTGGGGGGGAAAARSSSGAPQPRQSPLLPRPLAAGAGHHISASRTRFAHKAVSNTHSGLLHGRGRRAGSLGAALTLDGEVGREPTRDDKVGRVRLVRGEGRGVST